MGAGIAQVAAVAGHPVLLLDNRPGAAQTAIEGLRAQLGKLADKGKMTAEAAQAAGQRLQAAAQLSDLAPAALVVEAIVESLPAKQQLFADLEKLVSADCIFGTNTSSISITAIGSALQLPQRLAGLHFFNPAPIMALVEVVSGLATEPRVAEALYATATAWGKTAVHAKSTPGFIVNRVARPYYAEALRLRSEGAADCATLDAVMRESGGFRMGPFELMDMIGLDVNFAVTRSVWNAYFNDPRYLPSLIQQDLVDAGFLGKRVAVAITTTAKVRKSRCRKPNRGMPDRHASWCVVMRRRPRHWPHACKLLGLLSSALPPPTGALPRLARPCCTLPTAAARRSAHPKPV